MALAVLSSAACSGAVSGQHLTAAATSPMAQPSLGAASATPSATVPLRTAPTASPKAGVAAPLHSVSAPPPIAPTNLPNNSSEGWRASGPVQVMTPTGHDIGLNECASVHGATGWQQQGFASSDSSSPATEDTFTFGDSASAAAAYSAIVSGMDECQATSRAIQRNAGVTVDAVVTRTATAPHGAAWSRHWFGVTGISMAGPQTNHVYVVTKATSVAVLQFTEPPGSKSAPYDTSNDAQTLSALNS